MEIEEYPIAPLSGLNEMERQEKVRRLREDEAHRALGHYVFAFASVISEMREAVEYILGGDDRMNAQLAMGAAPAEQITNTFFAICERLAEFDDEERQVATRLKNEVTDAIAVRNDFAHGDWISKWPDQGPTLRRTKPGRRAGAWIERVRPVEEIDALADALEERVDTITEFAMLCFGVHPLEESKGMAVRVRDIFRFRKHQILRIGRYADHELYDDDE
jgi:hypothetical protein